MYACHFILHWTCTDISKNHVPLVFQVNVPKARKTFCKATKCRKHTLHKVTQYKKGKDSIKAQGKLFKYD